MPIEAFSTLRSQASVIDSANIDTDIIYPARFLLVIDREGIGQYAFHDWRRTRDGLENPEFPAPALFSGAQRILVAGENFGCGSSREHAVWTLADLGIRCVIAPGFGEIFYNNCFKNGVLPVALPVADWIRVREAAAAGGELAVDLQRLQIDTGSGVPIDFEAPEQGRNALLNGWDEIDMLLAQDGEAIRAFEARRRANVPWLFRSLADTD
jgi:3-isopropylmalate dehydratase small subunit